MKKKIIALLCGILFAVAPLSACGQSVEGIDKDRTQIYVSAYSGGYGIEWLDEIKAQFEKDYPKYQVIINATMNEDLSVGATTLNYNVYFTTTSYAFKSLVAKDLFVDLSDIYEKAVFDETVKVKEKVQDYELISEAFSYPGKSGIYALPFTKLFSGFVYDHDLFKSKIDKGWLIAASTSDKSVAEAQGITVEERNGKLYFVSSTGKTNYVEGDVLLRAGKDGKFGTYDDGQPITMKEWNRMLLLIQMDSSRKAKPVTYTDTYGYVYTLPILEAMFAQYEGTDNYKVFANLEGTYKHGGSETVISPKEGYKVYEMEGLEKAVNFYYNNICSDDNTYIVKDSDNASAQNRFLLYNSISKSEYATAMLVEGPWWENEARAIFDALGQSDASYKYGNRDYRYMLLPVMEGQAGIDGEGNGSFFSAQDMGLTLVANKGTEDVIKMSKKFVEYTLKDENLRYFTKVSGTTRPYSYDMSDEDLSSMTKFQRTVYNIIQDTENVSVIAPAWYQYCSPLSFGTSVSAYSYRSQINETAGLAVYDYPVAMRNRVKDKDAYLAGMKAYYKDNWNTFYNTVKNFYE